MGRKNRFDYHQKYSPLEVNTTCYYVIMPSIKYRIRSQSTMSSSTVTGGVYATLNSEASTRSQLTTPSATATSGAYATLNSEDSTRSQLTTPGATATSGAYASSCSENVVDFTITKPPSSSSYSSLTGPVKATDELTPDNQQLTHPDRVIPYDEMCAPQDQGAQDELPTDKENPNELPVLTSILQQQSQKSMLYPLYTSNSTCSTHFSNTSQLYPNNHQSFGAYGTSSCDMNY